MKIDKKIILVIAVIVVLAAASFLLYYTQTSQSPLESLSEVSIPDLSSNLPSGPTAPTGKMVIITPE